MRGNALRTLTKSAIYTKLAKDGLKLARKQLNDIDADEWLHKIGLSTYKPAKFGFGGFSLFLLGAAAGALAGLALAPKPGVELRTAVRDRATDMFRNVQQQAQQPGPEAGARA